MKNLAVMMASATLLAAVLVGSHAVDVAQQESKRWADVMSRTNKQVVLVIVADAKEVSK